MEAASTSESSVNFDQTTRSFNPEDSLSFNFWYIYVIGGRRIISVTWKWFLNIKWVVVPGESDKQIHLLGFLEKADSGALVSFGFSATKILTESRRLSTIFLDMGGLHSFMANLFGCYSVSSVSEKHLMCPFLPVRPSNFCGGQLSFVATQPTWLGCC